MTRERPPAVAGLFYTERSDALVRDVRTYLRAAESRGTVSPEMVPKALIAPHAGYVYSAPIAASAYRLLEPARDRVHRVVIVGPTHRVGLRGLGVPTADTFVTPIGPIPVDGEAVEDLLALPQVVRHDAAHAPEHSIEVHLPFLQVVLDSFAIVPLLAGEAHAWEVAEVLERVWGGPETVIVISTDLSHYQDYETARALDEETSHAIEELRLEDLHGRRACGFVGLKGLLEVARRRRLTVQRLDLRNSGDTAGPRDHVVGYGAWALREPSSVEVA